MKRPRQRKGAILVAALVCLLVSLSLVSTMIAGTLQRRAQLKIERQARQALHLLAAAHDRARQQLLIDSGYVGETWETVVSKNERGVVRIKTTLAEGGLTRTDITAVFPVGSARAVQRSGTFYLPQPDSTREKPS